MDFKTTQQTSEYEEVVLTGGELRDLLGLVNEGPYSFISAEGVLTLGDEDKIMVLTERVVNTKPFYPYEGGSPVDE